ncbi:MULTISPECIES: putative hydroxymethylpyrimidine transporter CytX [unclassified Sedimentibacter]|uniref:putative hydroxymethylpyrimidine transporter CytX n=1 Tax=unclassified Sedimentibacter TaxID=2649220 RepID=UPI0027E0D78E|nr:putative hydroxymethylpyrimidine transporter CytX [Sedimentibacter sp. MB35-C1]WMJ76119.1 putative hydroxymethylpyrimidine transporter CytX [Sedimentibacter sp. MB35-C1]
MESYKTSTLSNGLLWFGAAISIAEIYTGTLFVPLGFEKGFIAIVIGHIIGCILLYYSGIIGAESKKSSMESVGFSFGVQGRKFFALLNVLQLVGWTAVMIMQGSKAMGIMLNSGAGAQSDIIWSFIIGAIILLWVVIGYKNLEKINIFTIGGLFILTVLLGFTVFSGTEQAEVAGSMSFGMAIELSIAMPLSWLPLISDYTKNAKHPKVAARASVITYFIGSVFMYSIGLGAALYTGESDIAAMMLKVGFGLMGVLIILFSTVTTTFLDVYSAGVSFNAINSKLPEKTMAIAACVSGTLLAVFTPVEQYENFLYLIGSVFAPMISILIADYFILKKDNLKKSVDVTNFIIWGIGFILYRLFLNTDTIIGSTLPVMILSVIMCVAADKFNLKK